MPEIAAVVKKWTVRIVVIFPTLTAVQHEYLTEKFGTRAMPVTFSRTNHFMVCKFRCQYTLIAWQFYKPVGDLKDYKSARCYPSTSINVFQATDRKCTADVCRVA